MLALDRKSGRTVRIDVDAFDANLYASVERRTVDIVAA